MTTTVIVGKKTDAGDDRSRTARRCKRSAGEKYWPVDIAYFDETDEGGEEMPEYRISFKLHENGLTRDLDHGLWRLRR